MAVSITDKSHLTLRVYVDGLPYQAFNYDYFRYVFSQNGVQTLNHQKVINLATYDFTITFSNSSYLGYNWFTPATSYSVTVFGKIHGVEQNLGSTTFTTDSISPPTSTISPSVYPVVKNQGSYGNCVAMSLSAAMEIFKSRAMGYSTSYENFSVSYIYGSDGGSGEYMTFETAVNNCKLYGSPRWELITTAFPDSKSKADSVTLFNGRNTLATNNAAKQKFTGSSNVDFYDCASVQNAIATYGYFMLNFKIPNNFYSVGSDGIVPQPSGGWSGGGHSIALIGLTTINNKKYWIAQNSWGTGWGLNGRCYIPYDWGCGAQSSMGSSNTGEPTGWTYDCYSVWNGNISTSNPVAPTGLTASQVDVTTTVNTSWNNYADVLIYARKQGTTEWFPKPSYGSLFYGTSGQVSFDANDTTYEIMAISVYDNLLSQQSSVFTIRIVSTTADPWYWNSSELNAFNNNGDFSVLTAARWNDFCDKINEVCLAANDSWITTYTTPSGAKASGSGVPLTALMFNSVRFNIGSRVSTGITEVSTGDTIYGWYFITLQDKLNQWIASL